VAPHLSFTVAHTVTSVHGHWLRDNIYLCLKRGKPVVDLPFESIGVWADPVEVDLSKLA